MGNHGSCSTHSSLKSPLWGRGAGVGIKEWVTLMRKPKPQEETSQDTTASVTGAEQSITRARLHCPAWHPSWVSQHLYLPPSPWQMGWAWVRAYDLPAHAPLSWRKVLEWSPQNQKHQWAAPASLSTTLLLAASPSSSFPHSRAGIREETALQFPNRCSARNPPMNRNSCSSASSLFSWVCEESSPCRETGRRHPWALDAPSLSSLVPAQGAGSSNRSADLPQLVLAGSGEEKPQKSIGTAWKEIPAPLTPILPGPDSNACSQTRQALLC